MSSYIPTRSRGQFPGEAFAIVGQGPTPNVEGNGLPYQYTGPRGSGRSEAWGDEPVAVVPLAHWRDDRVALRVGALVCNVASQDAVVVVLERDGRGRRAGYLVTGAGEREFIGWAWIAPVGAAPAPNNSTTLAGEVLVCSQVEPYDGRQWSPL